LVGYIKRAYVLENILTLPVRHWRGSSRTSRAAHKLFMLVVSHPTSPLSCAVPQGSVLGPKTFSVYTEDIDDIFARHALQHHCYADDTQTRVSAPPPAVAGLRGNIPVKNFSNRLRTDKIMVMSLWPRFWLTLYKLTVSPTRNKLGERAFFVNGPTTCNSLTYDIRKITDLT